MSNMSQGISKSTQDFIISLPTLFAGAHLRIIWNQAVVTVQKALINNLESKRRHRAEVEKEVGYSF